MLKAVMFDMDGVLVDTEGYIRRAAMRMFEERGLNVRPEDFLPFVGAGDNRYVGGVAEKYGFPLDDEEGKQRTYEIYAEIAREEGIEPLPGVVEFIELCRNRGLKTAVATSADEFKMDINLKGSGIGRERFDVLTNGLEVDKKKPDPEIYLITAGKLECSPEECLVVEDAVNGVEAARAAGARCLALTTSFAADLLEAADWIVPDLSAYPRECLEW
jgi:HAD superfamily hydrolase (TIGR01509 family)